MLTETMTSFECSPSFLTFNCSMKDGTAGACLSPINLGLIEQSGISLVWLAFSSFQVAQVFIIP